MLTGKVDTSNQALRIRLHQLSSSKAEELRTQLTRELNLIDLIDFSLNANDNNNVSTKAFSNSINQYTHEWEQALLNQANNEQVQDLITEIIALPLEMKRLIDKDRGEFLPHKVRQEPKNDPITEMVLKYHRLGRLTEVFKI